MAKMSSPYISKRCMGEIKEDGTVEPTTDWEISIRFPWEDEERIIKKSDSTWFTISDNLRTEQELTVWEPPENESDVEIVTSDIIPITTATQIFDKDGAHYHTTKFVEKDLSFSFKIDDGDGSIFKMFNDWCDLIGEPTYKKYYGFYCPHLKTWLCMDAEICKDNKVKDIPIIYKDKKVAIENYKKLRHYFNDIYVRPVWRKTYGRK